MLIRVLLAIIIIGALAAVGLFIRDYYDETSAADSLESQIASTRKIATTVADQTKDIEAEIAKLAKTGAEIKAALEAQKEMMPDRVPTNSIVEEVLMLGMQTNVQVIPLSTQDWTGVKVGEGTYSVFRMKLEVSGQESRIIDFVENLQSTLYDTLAIESLSLTKTVTTPTPPATNSPTPAPVTSVTANLTFAVYAR